MKTTIDPEEAGYEVVLDAVALLLSTEQNSTEAGAVRRLLYHGAHYVLGKENGVAREYPNSERKRTSARNETSTAELRVSATVAAADRKEATGVSASAASLLKLRGMALTQSIAPSASPRDEGSNV